LIGQKDYEHFVIGDYMGEKTGSIYSSISGSITRGYLCI
jgi:hypothetical protein